MNITYLVPPGVFPSGIREPGKWFQEISNSENNIELYNANKEFWKSIFSSDIYDLLGSLINNNKLEYMKRHDYDSDRNISLCERKLNELTKIDTYVRLDKYIDIISTLAKHLDFINSIQNELNLNFITGITVKQLNYKKSVEIVKYSNLDTLLSLLIEKTLRKANKKIELLLVHINSPKELLTSMISVNLLKKKNGDLYACLVDHGYENFSFHQISDISSCENNVLKIFDSVIQFKEEKDFIVKALIDDLSKGNRKKGFLRAEDFDYIDKCNKIINPLPYIELYSPEPTLSTRISMNSCYWRRCTFCTQNSKYKNGVRNIIDYDQVLNQMEYFIRCGYTRINFTDEALSPEFLKEFSRRIIIKKLEFKWICRCRLDEALTKEILTLMKNAGCQEILFGLESTSERIVKLMNKYNKIPDNKIISTILNNTYQCGISIHITLIIGFPGEEISDATNTVNFIIDNLANVPNATYWINKFTLFNNTEIADNPEKFNIEVINNEEGDLIYFRKFKYKTGPYKDENMLNNLIKELNKRLRYFINWNSLEPGENLSTAMMMYYFTSHGNFIKSKNCLYPCREDNVKSH